MRTSSAAFFLKPYAVAWGIPALRARAEIYMLTWLESRGSVVQRVVPSSHLQNLQVELCEREGGREGKGKLHGQVFHFVFDTNYRLVRIDEVIPCVEGEGTSQEDIEERIKGGIKDHMFRQAGRREGVIAPGRPSTIVTLDNDNVSR